MTIDEKSMLIHVYSNNDTNMYLVDTVLIYMLVFPIGLLCLCHSDPGSRSRDLSAPGLKD